MLVKPRESYPCPKCGGEVRVHILTRWGFRWTCVKCQRDYGYNTDKPTFLSIFRLLTKAEAEEFLSRLEVSKTKFWWGSK